MGKRIIVKDADFSTNAMPSTTWYTDYDEAKMQGDRSFTNDGKFRLYDVSGLGMVGKTINVIKFYAKATGTIEIGNSTFGTSPTYSNVQTYGVSTGMNTLTLTTPLSLSATLTIYVKGESIFPYWYLVESDPTKGWTFVSAASTSPNGSRIPICLGFAVQ